MDSEGSGEDGCFRMMMINSPSSGMVANSTSDKVSASESMNHFYGSSTSWDLLGNFVDSSSAMASPINPHLLQNQAMAPQPPHILPSHSGQPDMLPGSFYGQSGRSWAGTQIPTTEDHCHNSSQVRRKRKQSIGEHKEFSKEEDDKKPESTQATKAKDCPEPSKENYIHVRAKRGQATNSHSLAERVRRERISERMRLLQELVPGCNKITGKAMMLDEIINYVQSLQQQVEFLSMKLATVNPELNSDVDRILSKEILHSTAPVITSGLHAFPGYHSDSAPPLLPPPQLWSNELQGILHTGFDADPSACSLGSNGLSKKAP